LADLYRELRRILLDAGCSFSRQGKGDHEIWFSPVTKETFSVDKGVKSRHSANAFLKDAGLPKRF
jgi:hypothetical protein